MLVSPHILWWGLRRAFALFIKELPILEIAVCAIDETEQPEDQEVVGYGAEKHVPVELH